VSEKDKNCCSNPHEVQLDEKSLSALKKFAVYFVLVLVVVVALLYVFREAPGIRHLYMSPQQMREHFNK
jgi:hypothetical protein